KASNPNTESNSGIFLPPPRLAKKLTIAPPQSSPPIFLNANPFDPTHGEIHESHRPANTISISYRHRHPRKPRRLPLPLLLLLSAPRTPATTATAANARPPPESQEEEGNLEGGHRGQRVHAEEELQEVLHLPQAEALRRRRQRPRRRPPLKRRPRLLFAGSLITFSAVALPRFEGIDLCKVPSPTMKNSDGDHVQRKTLLELVAPSTEINQS
ncbi:hypothetical protein F2P56_017426, partial [Juglans regia]